MHVPARLLALVLCCPAPCLAQAHPPSKGSDPLKVKHRFAAKDAEIERKLQQPVAGVNFDEAPLDQVLAWLQATAKVNMHVRWRTLEALGVERNHPISVHLQNLPLDRILKLILRDAGDGDVRVSFEARDGVLLISALEDLFSTMVTRVYPARDLLDGRIAQLRRLLSPRQSSEDSPSARPTLVQSADPAFRERLSQHRETAQKPRPPDPRLEAECLEQAGMELIDLLQTSIMPDSWLMNGGLSSIVRFNSTLVIRAPYLVHKQVEDLFAQMRANGAADTQ